MAAEIALTTATRTNLLSLQNTTSLIGRTQERLATGLKVNSAIDDALAFFKARNLNSRASDLQTIKDGVSDGINVIKAGIQGLGRLNPVLKQMKALAPSAICSPRARRVFKTRKPVRRTAQPGRQPRRGRRLQRHRPF